MLGFAPISTEPISTLPVAAGGGGPTPVSASRGTTWHVKAVATSTRPTTWDVRTVISQTRPTTWDALASVSAARSTEWAVASALIQVSASRATTWDVFYTIPPFPVGSIRTTYWSVNRPTFRVTPQTVEAYWNRNILIGRYGTTTGRTLIVKDGDVQFVESPLDVTLNAADWYVLGGHDQTISESQAQDLIDAGYGALVENA